MVQLPSHFVPIAVPGAVLEGRWELACTSQISRIKLSGESTGNFQQLKAGKGIDLLDWDMHMQIPRPENVCSKPGDTKESYDLSCKLDGILAPGPSGCSPAPRRAGSLEAEAVTELQDPAGISQTRRTPSQQLGQDNCRSQPQAPLLTAQPGAPGPHPLVPQWGACTMFRSIPPSRSPLISPVKNHS